MAFEIIPKQGLGLARFGMSPEQIEKIFGTVEVEDSSTPGRMDCYYQNWINAGFEDRKLCLIGATRQAVGITYKGVDIFHSDPLDVLRMLERDCGKAHYSYGFVIFVPFGISLTGFHDGNEDEKAMAIDLPQAWESDTKLKLISFLK